MKTISLLGVASDFPEAVIGNDFFGATAADRKGMFTPPTSRRHLAKDDTAAAMIERASQRLITKLGLDADHDIDLLFTNVALPDQAFTGCGAEVADRLKIHPRYVLDLHNTGCVSFIYMIELARLLFEAGVGRGALLSAVQDAAGRVFAQPALRGLSQAPVPGDGCGVGYLAVGDRAPVLSVIHETHGEFARDMIATAPDGRRYWEPGTSPISLGFTEQRVASIIHRGNQMVPAVVRRACELAKVKVADLKLLITNQPNPIFLRNWREALELPTEAHHDTYDRYGNLFGAAIPVNLEDALANHKIEPGDLVALGGFSHAGDYAAAAVIRWG
jgi:3-oxoacyl-[acyl-carrier-protein] synthase-3